jgi:ABC transport system ATP-binding/permease protein
VLVTHDRYMLDRVSNIVLGLDGQGNTESFADYSQWESWQAERKSGVKAPVRSAVPDSPAPAKKKLSYLESREYAGIEQRIIDAEELLQTKRAALEDPSIASDGPRLLVAHAEMEKAETDLDKLYKLWAELEAKAGNLSQSHTR